MARNKGVDPGTNSKPIGATQHLSAELFKSMAGLDFVIAPCTNTRAVIERLNREINAAIAAPGLKQRFLELGVEPLGGTPEAFRKHIAAEISKWRGVIEKANIPKE